MLVVDLLHEFELGVWKAVFTHLIRLLYAAVPAGRLVTELNRRSLIFCSSLNTVNNEYRFRLIPPFGRSTIRRFCSDASQMRKLAARNFEDLLQVCPLDFRCFFLRWLTNHTSSVPFLFLMIFCPNRTTRLSRHSSFALWSGTLSPNCGYTQIRRSLTWSLLPRSSAKNYGGS